MGALLRNDAATSLRAWALFTGQNLWQEWGHLLDSIKTGGSASQRPTGTEGPRPAVFNHAMVELTRLLTPAVVQAYDFTGCRRIIDVGGGHGELLVAILQAYPEACGVLFDLPHVVAQGRQHLARADLAHRCECVAGDFLEAMPGEGDAYVLKSILHNWTDAQSTRILDNCRRAMPAGAKLLVVEGIMPERLGVSAADQAYARLDLLRLITVAAQERTAAEYRALLASAGFHLTRIIPVEGLSSLMEATPI
jgi:ubiquinone/menaquinone biosynthesis C-methylase UbiE